VLLAQVNVRCAYVLVCVGTPMDERHACKRGRCQSHPGVVGFV
jgi:hypothetical protein